MKYIQHFHHLFNDDPNSPEQNLVTVQGKGFELLPQTMRMLLEDDEMFVRSSLSYRTRTDPSHAQERTNRQQFIPFLPSLAESRQRRMLLEEVRPASRSPD